MNMLIEYRGQATSALVRWGKRCWARGGVHVWRVRTIHGSSARLSWSYFSL